MEIKVKTILSEIVTEVEKDLIYYIKDDSLKINVELIEYNGKQTIRGAGRYGHTSIIKGYVEEYKKQQTEITKHIDSMTNLLNNIISLSKNTIEFTDTAIYRNEGRYILYTTVNKYDEEYGFNRKVGFIEIDCNTLEIINKSKRNNDKLDQFIVAYNKLINNTIEEVATTEVKKYYIVGNTCLNTYKEAYNYCIASDFDPEIMIEEAETPSNTQTLLNDIKQLDKDINTILDRIDVLTNIRESKGYSKSIYKCNDIEAIELIELENKIENIQLQQDEIRKQYKEVFYKIHTIECIEAHKHFKSNKYKVTITSIKNGSREVIYTNDIEIYKNINSKYIMIEEYINYNNTINKEVNKPVLKIVYNYNAVEGQKYISELKINQSNNCDYEESYKNIDSDNATKRIYLLDNNNKEYGYIFDNNYICIHKEYNSASYFTISKHIDNKDFNVTIGTINHFKVAEISKDMQDDINKILNRLKNNKSYNYNIQQIKDMLKIA